MGCVNYINKEKYPEQYEHKSVEVCFHYDTKVLFQGKIIRDDKTEPYRTVIQLDDGRVLLGTECQFSYARNRVRKCK